MGKPRIFVDGAEGTTGLLIHEQLSARDDLELLAIDAERRKDPVERGRLLNTADVAILCLPDVAARESVALASSPGVRIIDASTAFRTAPGWTYGLPELTPSQRISISKAERVSVPGCHATGFLLAVRPLVDRGILPAEFPVASFSLTGYSGGGKKLIATYEGELASRLATAPYSLALGHKHLPEMQHYSGLKHAPLFQPVVGGFYRGMIVSVLIETRLLPRQGCPESIHDALAAAYSGERSIRVMPLDFGDALIEGMLSPTDCNGTNRVDVFVAGHSGQVEVLARLDNLGKGASGAALQCLNLMLGFEEFLGLELGGGGRE